MVAATAVATAIAYWLTGSTLEVGRVGRGLLVLLPMLLGISWFYRAVRPDPWISRATEAAAQMMLIAVLATLLSFPLAAAGARFPYRDAWFADWDQALGFDWRTYVGFMDARPTIQLVMKICYLSMNLSYPLVLLILSASGQRRRLDCFIIALWLSLMLTLAVFFSMPATAAYAHFGVSLQDLRSLRPTFLLNRFLPLLELMREAGPHVVRLDDLEGLVTFPSFHTEAAILFTWAVWFSRSARWPMLLLNLAMVVAAPVEGAHYLVDIIAGAAVAAAAIAIAGALEAYCAGAKTRVWDPVGLADARMARSRRRGLVTEARSRPGAGL